MSSHIHTLEVEEELFIVQMSTSIHLFIVMSFALSFGGEAAHGAKFGVGLVVDERSPMGEVVKKCIEMAVDDFYAINAHYNTKINLHVRNSAGDPLLAFTYAVDLLENIKVGAIIIPEMLNEVTLFARLSHKARVPMFSFSSLLSPNGYPYFVQISQDGDMGLKGIVAFIIRAKWKNVILIHDETEYGMKDRSGLIDLFQEVGVRVVHKTTISHSAEEHQIIEKLTKLKKMETSIFIVHLSASLTPLLFENAKRLGLMAKGYAWIVSDKTMNFLHTFNDAVIESMQGSLGFKSYIPASGKLKSFTLKWLRQSSTGASVELNVFGIWAYDAVWALAMAIEKVGKRIPQTKEECKDILNFTSIGVSDDGGLLLLKEVISSRFIGLAGEFQLLNGELGSKAYEVVNVMDQGERRVGFWTLNSGFTIHPSSNEPNNLFHAGLDSIIWPGPSLATPKEWLGKKIRVVVPIKQGFKEFINVHHDIQSNTTTVEGFSVDVFLAAIGSLEYKSPFEFIPFLVVDEKGKRHSHYGDLLHQIYLKNFDAAVGDITITSNRSTFVDFTLPYTEAGVGTVARLGSAGAWFFLKPFRTDLWIIIVVSFIVTGIVVWLIEHEKNEDFQGSLAQQVGTALWFAASTLVYAQRERIQSNLSRFVVSIWMFVVLIISSSYTASLSSLLTLQQIRIAKGDYIGYHSFQEGIIFNNMNFSGSRLIRTAPRTNGFGFAFEKGSPLVPEISRAIARLREEGKLAELEDKWFKSRPSMLTQDDETSNIKTLNVDNFRGLFLLNGISKAIAVTMFLCVVLGNKLSVYHYILRIALGGKLAFMIKYLFRRKEFIIEGHNENSHNHV
nr:glutamate receptor 1.2-like [Ipomoea batatas]